MSTPTKVAPMAGIYLIQNKDTDEVYVGSSKDIKRRWETHRKDLDRGRHHSIPLQAAWEVFGAPCFLFEVLETTSLFDLKAREQYWIDTLRPDYNVAATVHRRQCEPGVDVTLEHKAEKVLSRSSQRSKRQTPVLFELGAQSEFEELQVPYGLWGLEETESNLLAADC